MKRLALAIAITMATSFCAMAAGDVTRPPPAAPYEQVSELVKLRESVGPKTRLNGTSSGLAKPTEAPVIDLALRTANGDENG